MRPKVVFLLLVLVECFLLILLVSPRVTLPWSLMQAREEYFQSHSPAAEKVVRREEIRARRYQWFICYSAGGVLIAMILYGGYRKLYRDQKSDTAI